MKLSKTMVFKLFSIITMFIRQTTLYSKVANSYLPPERAQVPPEVCYCEVERGRERKRESERLSYIWCSFKILYFISFHTVSCTYSVNVKTTLKHISYLALPCVTVLK